MSAHHWILCFSFFRCLCLYVHAFFQLRVSSESEFSDDDDLNNALAALNNRRVANAIPNASNSATDDSASAAADLGAVADSGPAFASASGPAPASDSVFGPSPGSDPALVAESRPSATPGPVPLIRAATSASDQSNQSNQQRPVFQPVNATATATSRGSAPKTVADLARLAVEPAAVAFDFGWLDDMHENDEDFERVCPAAVVSFCSACLLDPSTRHFFFKRLVAFNGGSHHCSFFVPPRPLNLTLTPL